VDLKFRDENKSCIISGGTLKEKDFKVREKGKDLGDFLTEEI